MLETWRVDEQIEDAEEKRKIKEIIGHKLNDDEEGDEVCNLMVCRNKNIFVWSRSEQLLFCFSFSDQRSVQSVRSLALTKPPVFQVRALLLSPSGRYLAVYGDRGLSVVELPQKLNQRREFFCRSWSLDERFFVCSQKIQLLEARWHPGDADDALIALLTNDNFLRVYQVDAPRVAVQQINLGVDQLRPSPFAASLGEGAVSFDFGPAEANNEQETELSAALWPVFVLKGNGDLLLLHSCLHNAFVSRRVTGPLTMLPAAEDNYEIDAARLVCLDTLPPVLVIASASGSVYNCVVLQDEEGARTVFVYECIELFDGGEGSVLLHRDPIRSDRYFVAHPHGVHSITLPLVDQLQSEDFEDLGTSAVHHLLSTRPVRCDAHHSLRPIGLVVSGHTHLRVLLSSGDSLVQRLPVGARKDGGGAASSLDDALEFDAHIAEILRRDRSAPLLKCAEGEVGAEQKLQLLLQSTAVFRQEYLGRMHLAHSLIARRAKTLAHEKRLQLSEVRRLAEERARMCEQLAELGGKFDAALEKQSAVTRRLEKMLERVQGRQAELSEAERAALAKMRAMRTRTAEYSAALEKLKLKQRFREEGEQRAVVVRSHFELKKIKDALESEDEAIALLVSRLRKALQFK